MLYMPNGPANDQCCRGGVACSSATAADPTTFADALAVLERCGQVPGSVPKSGDAQLPPSVRRYLHEGAAGKHPETLKWLPAQVRNLVIGNNARALAAAKAKAEELGYPVLNLGAFLEGDTQQAALLHAGLIRSRYPNIPRRVSGYNLDELLPESGFNVARALVGTESTCVTILQAELMLIDGQCLPVLEQCIANGSIRIDAGRIVVAGVANVGADTRYRRWATLNETSCDDFVPPEPLRATAARISALNAFASISSPS